MAVPKHFRISVRGVFGTTPEGWNYGMHFQQVQEGNVDAEMSDVDESAVSAALATFHGQAFFTNKSILTEWRCYTIGTDGRMTGNGPLLHEYGTPVPGGNAGAFYPPQIALAVTTVADDRGPAKLGRFFLPGVMLALQNDMRITDAEASTINTATVAMAKGISDAIDMPGGIQSCDMLNVSGRPLPDGTAQSVDHFEIGRVYDTIRSRRRSLLEERFVGAQIDW